MQIVVYVEYIMFILNHVPVKLTQKYHIQTYDAG